MDDLRINISDESTLDLSLVQEDTLILGVGSEEDSLNVSIINDTGVVSYLSLLDKPSINGVTLQGDKSFEELGREDIANRRIKDIIDDQYNAVFGGTN